MLAVAFSFALSGALLSAVFESGRAVSLLCIVIASALTLAVPDSIVAPAKV